MSQNTALTKRQIQDLEEMGAKMPVRFTGKWKGQTYYKGQVWAGPDDNRIGFGKRLLDGKEGLVTDPRYLPRD